MSAHLDLDDVAAGHPAAMAELAKLRLALRQVAQSHAWLAFGECRSFGADVVLLQSHDADAVARLALGGYGADDPGRAGADQTRAIALLSGAIAALPLEDALKRAYYYYYYDEQGQWRGPETEDWDRWHTVAKVAAHWPWSRGVPQV